MMKGYDKAEAVVFITAKIHSKDHPELADKIQELVGQAIDADMDYMQENQVLDEDGYAGDGYYEDDEALEYIVEKLVAENDLTPDQAVKVAAFVDEYMDCQQAYLESKGMVDWE